MTVMVRLWSAGSILALVLAGCGSSQAVEKTSTPSSLNRGTTTHAVALSLNDMTMIGNREGWGLASGKVVVTHTGGRRWRNMTPHEFSVTSTHLLNNSYSSMAFAFPTVKEGLIAQEQKASIRFWRTTDGGIRWTVGTWKAPKTVIFRVFPGSLFLQFVNAHDGLILLSSQNNAGSTNDVLLRTTDGGIHWHLVHNQKKNLAAYLGPSSTTAVGDISGLSLSPSGWGLAAINTVIGGRAWVWTTTNSGISWTSRQLPLPHGSADDSIDEGAQAAQGPESGWLWLALYNNHTHKQSWFLEHTTDGGGQWTRIPWNQDIPPSGTLSRVFLWPQSQGVLMFVADSQGTEIWRWRFRDDAWRQVTHLPLEEVTSLSFLPSGDGWIVGNAGVYRTTNGGRTWEGLSPHMR